MVNPLKTGFCALKQSCVRAQAQRMPVQKSPIFVQNRSYSTKAIDKTTTRFSAFTGTPGEVGRMGKSKSFLETVSAYNNEPGLGGGYILLGVMKNGEIRDSKYVVTGITDPDKLQNEITSQCRQCFNLPIRPIIKVIPHPQGCMLLVYISEANTHEKPVYIKSKGIDEGAYRRIGSSDQICTREDLDLLYQLRSKRKYDETLVENASFADFEPQAIKLYRYERERIKPDASEHVTTMKTY
jgi:predicted HTH transcriptional regulator